MKAFIQFITVSYLGAILYKIITELAGT